MINITLMVNGKDQTYKAAGMNLSASIEAYDLFREYDEAKGDYSSELLQRCFKFVCKIFGNAFSVHELGSGYKGSAFVLLPNILQAAVGYVDGQIVNFPAPPIAAERVDKIAS